MQEIFTAKRVFGRKIAIKVLKSSFLDTFLGKWYKSLKIYFYFCKLLE